MGVDGLMPRQCHAQALGTAHHGAGEVAARGGLVAAGQDELLQGGQGGVVVVKLRFEKGHVVCAKALLAGDAQLAAQLEQPVLQAGHKGAQAGAGAVFRPLAGQQQPKAGIGLVHGAERFHAQAVLAHAAAIAKPGAAVIAGAGVNAGQTFAHAAAPVTVRVPILGAGAEKRPLRPAALPGCG